MLLLRRCLTGGLRERDPGTGMMEVGNLTNRDTVNLGEIFCTYKSRGWRKPGRTHGFYWSMVCRISHSPYFVHSEDEMPKEQQEQYEALVRKRGEHIPLQH